MVWLDKARLAFQLEVWYAAVKCGGVMLGKVRLSRVG
jgi:hypothetical protein